MSRESSALAPSPCNVHSTDMHHATACMQPSRCDTCTATISVRPMHTDPGDSRSCSVLTPPRLTRNASPLWWPIPQRHACSCAPQPAQRPARLDPHEAGARMTSSTAAKRCTLGQPAACWQRQAEATPLQRAAAHWVSPQQRRAMRMLQQARTARSNHTRPMQLDPRSSLTCSE